MVLLAKALSILLGLVYAPLKLIPTQQKIVFLSRQADEPGIDFIMLRDHLGEHYPLYRLVFLCRRLPRGSDGVDGVLRYGAHMLAQLYHLATARVAVLDTYCVPVSLLRHKKDLRVVQIWHALGALKQFGWSIVGHPEGSSPQVAAAMKMHAGYDLAICSAPRCAPAFAEAFNIDQSLVKPIGLPRMDYLSQPEFADPVRERIFARYPQLRNGNKTIVYAPTFRKSETIDYDLEDAAGAVIAATDLSRFNLIVKTHSGQERVLTKTGQSSGKRFSGMEFLFVADYLISDYSSIIFEAALQGKPCYLYCFDLEEYLETRTFYLDYDHDIPAIRSQDVTELMDAISRDARPSTKEMEAFATSFVTNRSGTVTAELCAIIDRLGTHGDGSFV